MTHLLLQSFSHLEQMTGPNPTDRCRLETKRHILTDQDGIIPLPVVTTAANIHDVKSAVRRSKRLRIIMNCMSMSNTFEIDLMLY
jgi:hypothetical protein